MKKNFLKKSILFIITGIFIVSLQTHAQQNEIISVDQGGVPNEENLQNNKINYIDTKFCNNGLEEKDLSDNLSIAARPGEEKEICIIHFNRNDEDIYLWGGFPDNAIEPNGNSNCSSDYGRENPFSRFITPFKEEYVKVPAKSYIIRKTSIKFPIGINGIQKGCFAYGVDPGELEEGQNFLFVIRKISYINILVQGEGEINNKINISNITSNIDQQKKLSTEFDIQNEGSTDQTIMIKGEISNIFGYKKSFDIQGIKLEINSNKKINIKDFGVDIQLPRYKGLFNINLEIIHKPYFDFDISSYGIDSDILKEETTTQNTNIFIFPTTILGLLIIFIILIYLAFFRKPKVVYIQQTTPPNTPSQ